MLYRGQSGVTTLVIVASTTIVAMLGCSGGDNDDGGGFATSSGYDPATTTGNSGLAIGTTGADGTGTTAGTGTSGSSVPFEECTGLAYEAEGLALDMYIVFDHTASMNDPAGGDADCPLQLGQAPTVNSKWCYATHALAEYFTSPYATGNRAALQFMTVEDFVCEGGPNNGLAYAAVEMTGLPVDPSHTFIQALDQDAPLGGLGTRIEAALHGIADYTVANRAAGRTMIGVLITDGDPNGCSEDTNQLAGIIDQHYQQTGIRTFIIGMNGASENNLETYARVGGAPEHTDFCGDGPSPCHYWSVGNGEPEAFVAALREIQAAAILPCEFSIPLPPPDEILDYNLVNITITDSNGVETTLPGVASQADCDPQVGGWYYDVPLPGTPNSMIMCETSCGVAMAADRIDVSYGCMTVDNPVIR